jgi:hypothetical protein
MATSVQQLKSRQDEMVWVTDRYGRPVKRQRSRITERQRVTLEQTERRAAYVELFDPNGFLF